MKKQEQLIHETDDILKAMEITTLLASEMGFENQDVSFLKLVTEEACMNAYEYCMKKGYKDIRIIWHIKDKSFEMTVRQKGELFSIEFEDENKNINTGSRGRGIQIILSLMDDVKLHKKGEYIEFIMRKYKKI